MVVKFSCSKNFEYKPLGDLHFGDILMGALHDIPKWLRAGQRRG